MRTKRSRQIHLLLLASASLALTSCDQNTNGDGETTQIVEEQAVYKNLTECMASYSEEECNRYALVARTEHVRSAPRYGTFQDCERVHGDGQCQTNRTVVTTQTPDGSTVSESSVIMPMMLGYVVGHVSGAASQPKPLYAAPMSDRERECRQPGAQCPTRSPGVFIVSHYASGGSYYGSASSGRAVSGSFGGSGFSSGVTATARGGFGGSAGGHAGGGS